MRIKVTSLAILHQKIGMGYRKKKKMRENKRAKSSSIQKKGREKESEKKESSRALSKEAREGKLLKGVPLPPNIPHRCSL